MVIIGIDSHKRTHTAVAADEAGRRLGERTVRATTEGHLELCAWAARYPGRTWAVEDCRHLSRRLERDLLGAGQRVLRVPPALMAGARRSGREPGKSDPIDALAVARAALREPDLPVASLDGPERDLRLLVDHRDDLVAERTRADCRLRWHLHELAPGAEPEPRTLHRPAVLAALEAQLALMPGTVARLARVLVARIRALTVEIGELSGEIDELSRELSPSLLELDGCGTLSAAKLIGETAGVLRFRSRAAFARHDGSAPVPVWSGNDVRHRLNRGGNRQLNAALHRIAITQVRIGAEGKDYLARRLAAGDTKTEAYRALRRRISDEVYRRMCDDERRRLAAAASLEAAA